MVAIGVTPGDMQEQVELWDCAIYYKLETQREYLENEFLNQFGLYLPMIIEILDHWLLYFQGTEYTLNKLETTVVDEQTLPSREMLRKCALQIRDLSVLIDDV